MQTADSPTLMLRAAKKLGEVAVALRLSMESKEPVRLIGGVPEIAFVSEGMAAVRVLLDEAHAIPDPDEPEAYRIAAGRYCSAQEQFDAASQILQKELRTLKTIDVLDTMLRQLEENDRKRKEGK